MKTRAKKGATTIAKRAVRASNGAHVAPPADDTGLADRVERLAEVLRRHDLNEIEVELDGTYIRLRRGAETQVVAAPQPVLAQPSAAAPATAPQPGTPPQTAATSDGNVSYITSPFVGTFYRAPSPDSAPFVDAGTRIRKGQVLCIVEAMKLMNEIESEIDGTIVACLVENGHPVEYGEPLFKIRQD